MKHDKTLSRSYICICGKVTSKDIVVTRGEMMITLDDVFCLLHLPIRGNLYTPVPYINDEGVTVLSEELLEVLYDTTIEETRRQMVEYCQE
jgi:hypothetical protein